MRYAEAGDGNLSSVECERITLSDYAITLLLYILTALLPLHAALYYGRIREKKKIQAVIKNYLRITRGGRR